MAAWQGIGVAQPLTGHECNYVSVVADAPNIGIRSALLHLYLSEDRSAEHDIYNNEMPVQITSSLYMYLSRKFGTYLAANRIRPSESCYRYR